MLIQCTKKLLDQLKGKPESVKENEDPLFSWHANLLTIKRRKTVVLVNDSNRYVIVLYGLLAKDFKKIDELIPEAIRTVFREERIKDEVIEQFLQHSPTVSYAKTKDRTSVARMNKSIEPVHFFSDLLDNEVKIQQTLSLRASRYLVGDGTGDYIEPNQELYSDLERLSGQPVIQTEAVQVKVTLLLDNFQVWRRLVIPLHLTFRQLHEILQTAFQWRDYHLHEFYLYDDKGDIPKSNQWHAYHPAFHSEDKIPILNIVSNEEAFDYGDDIPMKLDTEIKLSDFLPKHKIIRYNYDFGDNWQHDIEVETFFEEYDKNYPVFLEGEGTTPPEDVGGEYGYEQFLEAISDENHPDHDHMVTWGHSQRWSKDFDFKFLNMMLKDNI